MARFLHRTISAIVLVIGIPSAQANFVMQTPANHVQGPVSGYTGPSNSPKLAASANVAKPMHWKTADGFGNYVPLSFACRQIIPPTVTVKYGSGVNPDATVSWKGGDTWNHVLRDTVRPLGLHLQMSFMAVTIEK